MVLEGWTGFVRWVDYNNWRSTHSYKASEQPSLKPITSTDWRHLADAPPTMRVNYDGTFEVRLISAYESSNRPQRILCEEKRDV